MGMLDLGRFKGIVVAITAFLVFTAIILAVTHRTVGQFASDNSGVKVLEQQKQLPKDIYHASLALSQRLKNGEPIEADLESLRTAADSFDRALSGMATSGAVVGPSGKLVSVGAL